jgi:hypothetical protein
MANECNNRLAPLYDAQRNAQAYRREAAWMEGPSGWGNQYAIREVDHLVRGSTGQFMSKCEYSTAMSMLHTAARFQG